MTMAVGNLVHDVWHIAIALGLLLSVAATGHVVLNKRDSRAAIDWVGFECLLPLVGAVLYFITAFTSQANRAYQVATHFRGLGLSVVMGGIHATMTLDEVMERVDSGNG